jgi:hypothetical protein
MKRFNNPPKVCLRIAVALALGLGTASEAVAQRTILRPQQNNQNLSPRFLRGQLMVPQGFQNPLMNTVGNPGVGQFTVNPMIISPQTGMVPQNGLVAVNPQSGLVTLNPVTVNPQSGLVTIDPQTRLAALNPQAGLVTVNSQTGQVTVHPVTVDPLTGAVTLDVQSVLAEGNVQIGLLSVNPQTGLATMNPVAVNPQTGQVTVNPLIVNPQTGLLTMDTQTGLVFTRLPGQTRLVTVSNQSPFLNAIGGQNPLATQSMFLTTPGASGSPGSPFGILGSRLNPVFPGSVMPNSSARPVGTLIGPGGSFQGKLYFPGYTAGYGPFGYGQ